MVRPSVRLITHSPKLLESYYYYYLYNNENNYDNNQNYNYYNNYFFVIFFRMADSVGSISVYWASDELTNPFCDPCFKDGTSRSVAGYCPKCVEFYCKSCLAVHSRMAMSERHKILVGSDMPACQADKPVKYRLCDKHDGEDKDKYCFDHGVTICGICAIRDHKQCQVKEVSEASKSFNMSAEKTSFRADVDLLLNHATETSQSIKSNKTRLEKKKQDILTEAQKQRDELVKKVHQSYQDFSGEVTSLFKDHTSTLSAQQSAVDEIVTEITAILQSLQQSSTKKQNDQKQFLELQYLAEKVRLCEDKIKLLNHKHIDVSCTLNTVIQPLILTKNKFGDLSLQTAVFQGSTELPSVHYPYTGPRQDPHSTVPGSGARGGHTVQSVKLMPLDKINVKIPDDKCDCKIWGIDITVDGKMLLTDNCNCNVKLFTPDGKLLSSLTTPDKPLDVTVINKSEATVSMRYKQIVIIDIADSGHLALKRTIKTEKYIWGITAYNNNLIVTCDISPVRCQSVQMIDMRGKVLWTATTDCRGKDLFGSASFLTTCSSDDGNTVIVTDPGKQTITVLDAGTGMVVKVCDVKGKKPVGVTVDDNGNVYVCDEAGEISVWSKDMQEETLLAPGSEYLEFSWAMAYNRRRSELVVTSLFDDTDYRNFIYRYKFSAI